MAEKGMRAQGQGISQNADSYSHKTNEMLWIGAFCEHPGSMCLLAGNKSLERKRNMEHAKE
jgi:hypothetical protein